MHISVEYGIFFDFLKTINLMFQEKKVLKFTIIVIKL